MVLHSLHGRDFRKQELFPEHAPDKFDPKVLMLNHHMQRSKGSNEENDHYHNDEWKWFKPGEPRNPEEIRDKQYQDTDHQPTHLCMPVQHE
jgi:hypothetical protein